MKKIIESENSYFISFTDEELKDLNINKDDIFDINLVNDGIVLKKREKIEINLSEYPREILEYIINESLEKNLLVSEIIETAVVEYVNSFSHGNYCDPEDD